MALYAFNMTTSAVNVIGNRTVTLPASASGGTRGVPVDVTSEFKGLTLAQYQAIEALRVATTIQLAWTGDPEYACVGMTVAAPGVTLTPQSTTTTVSALVQSSKVEFPSTTKAADLVSVVNAVLPSNVALTLALQPDVARKLQVNIVTGSTAGSLVLVGVDQNGNAATQTFNIATAGTVITDKAYATVTSATISGGSGFAGTVGIGLGAALGIPTNKTPAATAFNVYKAQVNGLNEAVGTQDTTATTIIPTTAPDASHSFAFWYNFTVTPTSPAHTHTLA
jgi:hypothetical protein